MSESTGDPVESLIGEFKRVEELCQLLPEVAESLVRKYGQLPGPGDNKIEKRMTMVRRILKAIGEDIDAIITFQFFELLHSLAPSSCKTVKAQIGVVGFKNDVFISNHRLFKGTLPCNSKDSGGDGWRNVVYYPVPAKFASDATEGYLVVIVRSEHSSTTAGYATRRSGHIGKRPPGLSDKKLLYGSRLIFQRLPSVDKLDVTFGNSSIRLKAICNIEAYWYKNRKLLAEMYSSMEIIGRGGPVPYITFELTDQHVEEDWDNIKEQRCKITERKLLTDTIEQSYEVTMPISVEDSEANSSSSNSSVEHLILLSKMKQFRCPFCLEDLVGSYQFMHHLNSRYPFIFTLKEDGVSIDVSHYHQENVYKSVSPVKIVSPKDTHSGIGPLHDSLVTVIPPYITPCSLYSIDGRKEYRFVSNPSNWIDEFIERYLYDYCDIDGDDIHFMRLVNEYMRDISEPMSSEQHKVAVMKDMTQRFLSNGSINHDVLRTRSAAMASTMFRKKYISQVSLNELLSFIFCITL